MQAESTPKTRRPSSARIPLPAPTMPVPAGRIERLARPFDPEVDLEDFASPAFHALRTGDWGVRYYEVPAGMTPGAILGRASSGGQTRGDLIPFADQVRGVVEKVLPAHEARGCAVGAIFWDCQTAMEVKFDGDGVPVFPWRQGFWTLVEEVWQRRYGRLWWWRTDRVVRGDLAAAHLTQAVEALRIPMASATEGTVHPILLTITGGITGKAEVRSFTARSREGRRGRVALGAPPGGQVPQGWLVTGTKKDGNIRRSHSEDMPVFARLLWHLAEDGFTWQQAADYLNTTPVRRPKTPELPWTDKAVRGLLEHDWWIGVGRVRLRRIDSEERDPEEYPVPPGYLLGPTGERRELTPALLEALRRLPNRRPGPQKQTSAPLAGRLRCARCKRRLVGHERKAKYVASVGEDGRVSREIRPLREPRWRYCCPQPSVYRAVGQDPCDRRPNLVTQEKLVRAAWPRVASFLQRQGALGARFAEVAAGIRAQVGFRQQDLYRRRVDDLEGQLLRLRRDQETSARALPDRLYERELARLKGEYQEAVDAAAGLEAWCAEQEARAREHEAWAAQLAGVDLTQLWREVEHASAAERVTFLAGAVAEVLVDTVPVSPEWPEGLAVRLVWDWEGLGALAAAQAGDNIGGSKHFYPPILPTDLPRIAL